MWGEKYVEPEIVVGFPHGDFELLEGQHNKVFFYPEGGYPQKAYRPDREHSILKVIEVCRFEGGDFYAGNASTGVGKFLERLDLELENRGGTGIGMFFDLNYLPSVHIVPTKNVARFADDTYIAYVEVDYPRNMGSWTKQIATKAAFSAAVKAAGEQARCNAKIVHIGMTNGFED